MKLIVEIAQYWNRKNCSFTPEVIPRLVTEDKDGELVLNKKSQAEEIARLMDLADVVNEAVRKHYINDTCSISSVSKNTSGEPSTT